MNQNPTQVLARKLYAYIIREKYQIVNTMTRHPKPFDECDEWVRERYLLLADFILHKADDCPRCKGTGLISWEDIELLKKVRVKQ